MSNNTGPVNRTQFSEMLRYYNNRKNIFENNIIRGSIGRIVFPEYLKLKTVEEINRWTLHRDNYKYLSDTLAFLGLSFFDVNESYRNPTTDSIQGQIIYIYKHLLDDDAKYNAFFNKIMEMKRADETHNLENLSESRSILNDDERTLREDDEETLTDERTLTQEDPYYENSELDEFESYEDGSDDESVLTDYVIPTTLTRNFIPKSIIPLTITNIDQGIDWIEGDKKVIEHLNEDPDNIVFVIRTALDGNKYFLTSKERLKIMIRDRTNIQYECRIHGPSLSYIGSNDVEKNNPMLKMTSLGLPIPYIYLSQIKDILESVKQIFIVSEEPIKKIIAVASDDILDGGNIANAAHCQHKEGDAPYSIYSLTYLDLEDIVEERTSKRKRVGGRTRRIQITSKKRKGNKNKTSKKNYKKSVKKSKKKNTVKIIK